MPTKTYQRIPDQTVPIDGYNLWMVCVPNHAGWEQATREALRNLSKGRYWDRGTGTITEAQSVGMEIYESMTNCTGIETALNNIADSLAAVNATTNINVSCCEQLTPPTTVTPPPEPIPPSGTQTPPPPYPDPQTYNEELCNFANSIHWYVYLFFDFLEGLSVAAAIIAIIIAGIGVLFPEPATSAIGGITIATIAGILLFVEGGLAAVGAYASEVKDFWELKQELFVCYIYNVVGATNNWKDMIVDHAVSILESTAAVAPARFKMSRIMIWLRPFIDWAETDLYEYGQAMARHQNPISCLGCTSVQWYWDFEDLSLGGFINHGVNLANQNGSLYVRPDSQSGFKWFDISANQAAAYHGMPSGAYEASQVTFQVWIENIGGELTDCLMQLQVWWDDDTTAYLWNSNTDLHPHGQWFTISVPCPPGTLRLSEPCLSWIYNRQDKQWPNGSYILVDEITVEN